MKNNDKKIVNEQIERALLLMKYDSSKTLTENQEKIVLKKELESKKIVENKQVLEESPEQLNEFIGPLIRGLVSFGSKAYKWLRPNTLRAATTLPVLAGTATRGQKIGKALGAGLTVLTITDWLGNSLGGGDSFDKTRIFFEGCDTNSKDLQPTLDKSAHRAAAKAIYDSVNYGTFLGMGYGTDEEAIQEALLSMPTVADLCEMRKAYNLAYGDLYSDLDADIDGEDFRTYVWSSIVAQIEDNLDDVKKVDDLKKYCEEHPEDTEKCGGIKCPEGQTINPKTNKCEDSTKPNVDQSYISCSKPPFAMYCMNSLIGEIQSCLGVNSDNKLGPITKKALTGGGYTLPLSQDSIDKILKNCGKENIEPDVEEPTPDEDFSDNIDDLNR